MSFLHIHVGFSHPHHHSVIHSSFIFILLHSFINWFKFCHLVIHSNSTTPSFMWRKNTYGGQIYCDMLRSQIAWRRSGIATCRNKSVLHKCLFFTFTSDFHIHITTLSFIQVLSSFFFIHSLIDSSSTIDSFKCNRVSL